VLDQDGRFGGYRCNTEMVTLEPPDDAEKIKFVRDMSEQHVSYTDSALAMRLLQRW
jgi:glutamate synthase (ferredoxin)